MIGGGARKEAESLAMDEIGFGGCILDLLATALRDRRIMVYI